MKRSTMIEVLEQNILETRGQLNAYQLAARLLDRIEELGMTPPQYDKILDGSGEKVYGKAFKRVCDITGLESYGHSMPNFYNAREWEPEDE